MTRFSINQCRHRAVHLRYRLRARLRHARRRRRSAKARGRMGRTASGSSGRRAGLATAHRRRSRHRRCPPRHKFRYRSLLAYRARRRPRFAPPGPHHCRSFSKPALGCSDAPNDGSSDSSSSFSSPSIGPLSTWPSASVSSIASNALIILSIASSMRRRTAVSIRMWRRRGL